MNVINRNGEFFNITLDVLFLKEDHLIVAFCPALDLTSYGDDTKDAQAAFDDALQIFIEESVKRGSLEKQLLSLGWSMVKKPVLNYTPPTISFSDLMESYNPIKSRKVQVALPV